MTDLPPRNTPPRDDDRPIPSISTPQTGMWVIVVVLAAAIVLAVTFTVNRSGSGTDRSTVEPAFNDPVPDEPDTPDQLPAVTDANPGTATGTETAPATGSGGTTTSP